MGRSKKVGRLPTGAASAVPERVPGVARHLRSPAADAAGALQSARQHATATLLLQYGFVNAFCATVATGFIIFAAGLPISIYTARHGVDMDLLTRGAGFGYVGATLTSLIYAPFPFIFFALVTHGVAATSRLQLWTQPLWLVMVLVRYGFVLVCHPGAFAGFMH